MRRSPQRALPSDEQIALQQSAEALMLGTLGLNTILSNAQIESIELHYITHDGVPGSLVVALPKFSREDAAEILSPAKSPLPSETETQSGVCIE